MPRYDIYEKLCPPDDPTAFLQETLPLVFERLHSMTMAEFQSVTGALVALVKVGAHCQIDTVCGASSSRDKLCDKYLATFDRRLCLLLTLT